MKNKYFYISLLTVLCLIFKMGCCFAISEVKNDDYFQGKEAGYIAGSKATISQSINTDLNNKNVLICQVDVPPPLDIPQKSEEYVRGYKDGWNEGYKKGFAKGSEEGNEGYIMGFLLGLIGVIFAYIM